MDIGDLAKAELRKRESVLDDVKVTEEMARELCPKLQNNQKACEKQGCVWTEAEIAVGHKVRAKEDLPRGWGLASMPEGTGWANNLQHN